MIRKFIWLALPLLLACSVPSECVQAAQAAKAVQAPGRYAIVVRKEAADGPWGRVVEYLVKKHAGKAFTYKDSVDEVRKEVGAYHPRWVCFVCPPTESFPEFTLAANVFAGRSTTIRTSMRSGAS